MDRHCGGVIRVLGRERMDPEYGFKSQIRLLVLGLQTQPSCPESIECAEKVEAIDAQHGGAAPGGTVEHADAGVF